MEVKYFVIKKRNLQAKCATTIFRLIGNKFQYFNMMRQCWENHPHYPNDLEQITSETYIVITEDNKKIAQELNKKLFYEEILD